MSEQLPLTFIFDVDGTLCPIKKPEETYEDLIPYAHMIDQLRTYKAQGAKIILHTSRNMRSYSGNLGQINAHTAKVLLAWLDQWEIPYDEIYYGKPWPGPHGFYVDDRALRPAEFLHMDLDALETLVQNGTQGLE